METFKILCPVKGGSVKVKNKDERNECTHIKCSIHYELGGHSFGTGQFCSRGYYLHVAPVSIGDNSERWMAFTGGKFLLVECKRRSSSKEVLAKVMFEKTVRAAVAQLFDTDGIDMSGLPYPPEEELTRELKMT